MDYIFGSVRKNGIERENLKTVGSSHTNLTGMASITRKYIDNHITDNFLVVEKYRSENGPDGKCYDWYVISSHSRYEDRFTPGIVETEREITEQDLALLEAEQELTEQDLAIMESEQEITDLDLRVMELEMTE